MALARVCSHALSLWYAQVFSGPARNPMPKPPSVDDLLASFAGTGTRAYELAVDPATRTVTHLRTDGTPGDHAAALEAMKVLFAAPLPTAAVVAAKTVPVAGTPPGKTLRQAMADYAKVEAAGLKPNTWARRQKAFASFADSVGWDRRVADITRPMAATWAHALMGEGVAKRTAANQVSQLAQLFAMLKARGEVGDNPVKGVVVMSKKEKRARAAAGFAFEAFDPTALRIVFEPKNLARARGDHMKWAAVIGLYTGARVGEIAALFLRDFVMKEGLPCVLFRVESDGQSLKTEASERLVPLHPDLLALGLWERVERLRAAGHERFFPDMRIDGKAGAGNAISKAFSYHLKTLHVRPRRANGIVGFHSLRKCVIQELQGSALSAERRRAFVGHEPGDDDIHSTHYMRPWTAEELAVVFPGLRWGEWLDVAGLRHALAQ